VALRALELPEPARMRGRWAAAAAIYAARGWAHNCHAAGPIWHYDDGGGNWVQLHHVEQDGKRAVLIAHDHEYSETYFGTAAEYFGEQETDLPADAPAWWGPPARQAMAGDLWVGFVYGYQDGNWQRADYDLDDGFASVALPAASAERSREHIGSVAADAPGLSGTPDPATIDALIAADGLVTATHVTAVIGPTGWSPQAGADAARAFCQE